jgi:GTP-binding protein HflX
MVDASNPRWEQQTASVDRILRDLEFDKIPRLLVFNKIDLVDQASLDAMLRQTSNQQGGASVAVSALDQNSLGSLLRRISEALGPAMAHYQAPEQPAETVQ